MIGRRTSQPKGITQASSRQQLHMFLASARRIDNVTAADLGRRYNLPLPEIQQALAIAQQRRERLV